MASSTAIFIDLAPLRQFPHFRRLWTGYLLRQVGAQVTVTAVVYQVFVATHSNLEVGLLGLAQLGPAVLAPMLGGAMADAVDRRRVLAVNAVAFALLASALALNASLPHPMLWPLYLISGLTWGLAGVDNSTRAAVIVTLVDRRSIVPANVLRQLLSQTSNLVGPGVAGLLIASFPHHLEAVYWVDVASTVAALVSAIRLPPLRPAGGGRSFGLTSIAEGFRSVRDSHIIQVCFLADFIAMFLGSPTSLTPYMALVHFHRGPAAYGLLSASPAIGAAVGAMLSGWTREIGYPGRWVLIAITVWGVAIVGFGLAPWFGLAVVCMAIAGWADSVSAVFRGSILQMETPDNLRGRVSSLQSVVVQSGPLLGNAEAGVAARLAGAPAAIVFGGIACLLGVAAIRRSVPAYWGYRLPERTLTQPDTPG